MSKQASVTSAARNDRMKVLTFILSKKERKKHCFYRTWQMVERLNDEPAQEPFQVVKEGRCPPDQEIEFL